MDNDKETQFFDGFVEAHGEYDVLAEGAYRRLLEWFATLVKPLAREVCVDLGCGTGAFTRRLRCFDLDLIGIDISPQSIAAANSRAEGDKYFVGDIAAIDLPDGSADIVVFSGVLHHCPDAALRVKILKEALRLLKPGGRLYAYDPSAHSPAMWLYRSPQSPLYSQQGKTDNEVLLSRGELQKELTQAGFAQVSIRGTAGTTFRYVEGPVARFMLPLYNLYEIALRYSPMENRWGTFLISFARKAP